MKMPFNKRSISRQIIILLILDFFKHWWLQMAFIAICYLYINLFALQHIADRPGKYRTYNAHQSLRFDHILQIKRLDTSNVMHINWIIRGHVFCYN